MSTTEAPAPVIDEEIGDVDDLGFEEIVAHVYDGGKMMDRWDVTLCGIPGSRDAHKRLHEVHGYETTYWQGHLVCPRCEAKICPECLAICEGRSR